MNGVGLTTVGRLLGHRQRQTTAIYAHLDDGALRDAAAQAAAVIACAMGFRAEAPPMPEEAERGDMPAAVVECPITGGPPPAPEGEQTPLWVISGESERTDGAGPERGSEAPSGRPALNWL